MDELKLCSKCGQYKAVSEFSPKRLRCRICECKRSSEWYRANREKVILRVMNWQRNNPEKKAAANTKWNRNNPDKRVATSKKWILNNPERAALSRANYRKNNFQKLAVKAAIWQQSNRERCALNYKKWHQNNRDRILVYHAEQRAIKIQRSVSWANRDKIRAIYAEAARLTKETKIFHHVDHEIPLMGKRVSGLHVETNLRVLTAKENQAKRNSFAV